MSDERRHQRRCRSCRGIIRAADRPWTWVDHLGNEAVWHTSCPEPKKARRG